MIIMAGVFIMIGLFSLGSDIYKAAQTIADAIRSSGITKGGAT